MYDIPSRKIIDYWTMLEDKYDDALLTLYHKTKKTNTTISNKNEMKYLDVCTSDNVNNEKKFQQYTHIHSFINDFISLYGVHVFHDYIIIDNNIVSKKRYLDHNQNNKIKRTKYE